MRRVLIALVVGVTAGCSTTSSVAPSGNNPAPVANRMSGHLTLAAGDGGALFTNSTHGDGASCAGQNGMDDIKEGAEVTVSDAAGKVVGVAAISAGTVTSGSCVFDFTVNDLPKSGFYRVEVSHRGQVTYPAAGIGDVELTLD